MEVGPTRFIQSYFHGTKADLKPGEMVVTGMKSNFSDQPLSWVYFSATLDAAVWGAELAKADRHERIYVVEPTGPIEDDPNLTDNKFPGNPTLSYRSREPLRIIAEVLHWTGHPTEQLKQTKEALAKMDAEGVTNIID